MLSTDNIIKTGEDSINTIVEKANSTYVELSKQAEIAHNDTMKWVEDSKKDCKSLFHDIEVSKNETIVL